jgi:hypothetical protein
VSARPPTMDWPPTPAMAALLHDTSSLTAAAHNTAYRWLVSTVNKPT